MLKKFLVVILVVVVCVPVFFVFGYNNLETNSVYYAKHTPHGENVEPVLMVLVDNIADVYHPELEGIGYDFDGKPAILFYDENGKQTGFITAMDYGYYYNDDNVEYDFNRYFSLIGVFDETEWADVDMETIDEKEVKRNLYDKLQPLIDKQTKPLINLQWLFDMLYKDKFH